MELELNKQKINFYDTVYETGAVHEECGEIIIPDSSPDMVRIVSSNGIACVKEKNIEDGVIVLSGNIVGCVLYIAEGEKSVRKLDVNMPFSKRFENSEFSGNLQCIHTTYPMTLEAREINPRKLALRAHVTLQIQCYMQKNIEISEDITEKSKFSIEVQNKSIDFHAPILIKERSFTIIDDLEIPSTNKEFETMLKNEVTLSCTDKKIIGNKAIMKGVANIKCTYAAKDGTVNVLMHNLPYSQIMDIEDVDENCELEIKMNIRACDIEPSHDMAGDARYISVNILVDTELIAYVKRSVASIDDVYSTTYNVATTFDMQPINKQKTVNKRVSVNEIIETANSVKKIIDTNVILSQVRKSDTGVQNDAYMQVMYIGDDDGVYCAQKRCTIECKNILSDNEKVICTANVSSEAASGNENKVTVQFFVDYNIKVMCEEKVRNLKTLTCGDLKIKNDDASVVIKHIYSEQSLWDIAKKYNTTVGEIADANGLEFSETIAAGSMLLIPCGK